MKSNYIDFLKVTDRYLYDICGRLNLLGKQLSDYIAMSEYDEKPDKQDIAYHQELLHKVSKTEIDLVAPLDKYISAQLKEHEIKRYEVNDDDFFKCNEDTTDKIMSFGKADGGYLIPQVKDYELQEVIDALFPKFDEMKTFKLWLWKNKNLLRGKQLSPRQIVAIKHRQETLEKTIDEVSKENGGQND